MNNLNSSQTSICQIVFSILGIEEFRNNIDKPSNSYIFSQIIRQYAEINNSYQKTWKKIELCKQYHQFTIRAASVLAGMPNASDIEVWQILHYEHIVPIKVIKQQLLNLFPKNFNMKNVVNIMRQNEVVILTKEEANVLDGSTEKEYPLEGETVPGKGMKSTGTKEQRLNAIGAQIDNRYLNNTSIWCYN